MKFVELVCAECSNPFKKAWNEYQRRLRVNPASQFFCSHSCAGVSINRDRHPATYKPLTKHLVADNRRDDLTKFRWFVARARFRRTRKEFGVTAEYLLTLWDSQGGACPITGWPLILPESTAGWPGGRHPRNASLDRIDHSKGYIEGNVRFVACIANYARNAFTDEDLQEFCEAVVSKSKTR